MSANPSPQKSTRMTMRSVRDARYLFKRDAPASSIVPKTFLSVRDGLKLSHRITEYMEDNDKVYRGEASRPDDYAPLTPENEDSIIAQLPAQTGLAVISGPPAAFLEHLSGPPPTPPKASRTYAGHRTWVTTAAATGSGENAAATVTLNGTTATASGSVSASVSVSQTVTSPSPRRSSRFPVESTSQNRVRNLLREYRRKYKLIMAYTDPFRPTPFVDSQNIVLSVILHGPLTERDLWVTGVRILSNDLDIFAEFGGFSGEANSLRWGIGFREAEGTTKAGAHTLGVPVLLEDLYPSEEGFTANPHVQMIIAYQNLVVAQFFPVINGAMANIIADLRGLGLQPAYPDSVFSTCGIYQITLASADPEKLWEVRFPDVMVGTVLGNWKSERGGHLMLHSEGRVTQLRAGDSFVVAAGAHAYSFVPVGERESMYVLYQLLHASVARWVEKGGLSDKELEEKAAEDRHQKRYRGESIRKLHKWTQERTARVARSQKLFTKIIDVASTL